MNKQTTARFESIKKPNVVEFIIDTLRQAIIKRELKPGERLPSETELGEQMGVGRSAVREALKVMEALGVVSIRPGAGTFVTNTPSANMLGPLVHALVLESETSIELFELRFSIQLGYYTIASRNADAQDWINIEAAASALESHVSDEHMDLDELIELDKAFHFAILKATHNPLIERVGQTVEDLFFASFRSDMREQDQPGDAVRDHRDIIDALKKGDGAQLKLITERILTGWQRNMAGGVTPAS